MRSNRLNTGSSASDTVVTILAYLIIAFVFIVTVYPFWNIFVISINDAVDAVKGKLYFWPRVFSLDSYRIILRDAKIGQAFLVSVTRTVITTPLAILFTLIPSYVLSKRHLRGRRIINLFFIITMYFEGGLIPYFMVIKTVGLYNSFLVYIIPCLFSGFNMILIRTYIEQLPPDIEESAKIDGASEYVILFRIILPLCAPIMATIAVFIGVGQWNSWFDSYIFMHDTRFQTIMALLVKILNQYQTKEYASNAEALSRQFRNDQISITPNSIRMATTIVAIVPIITIYPFLQKYFTKGIMVGAIKA